MHGDEFYKLSVSEQRYYDVMLDKAENFELQFRFDGASFDFLTKVFKAMLQDNPQLFWFQGGSRGNIKTRGSEIVVDFFPTIVNNLTEYEIKSMFARLKQVVLDVVKQAKRYTDVFSQVLFVHDYLVDNTEYVSGARNCHDAYGCLVDRRAVCSGYAAAFQLIMYQLHYICGRVTGDGISDRNAEPSHEWNYIKLQNDYYFVDVTWDDPTVLDRSIRDNKSYDFFCVDNNELSLTHRISGEKSIPYCAGKKYNYYEYQGFCLQYYSFSDVKRIAERQLQTESKFSVKFTTVYEAKCAVDDLVKNKRVYEINGIGNHINYSVSKSGLILKVSRG